MNLYIYSYNNYYNRILKKAGDLISDYESFLHYGPVTGVYGFTPGDGINTTQVIGSNVDMYDGKGDYLIAHNPNTNEIDSRWFIINSDRSRNGQWILTLHRDLMVDYYDAIIDAPCFIEKATLTSDNPLIFNRESINVNQIKQSETELKDATGSAWIVGYYDSKKLQEQPELFSVNIPFQDQEYDIAVPTTYEEWAGENSFPYRGPVGGGYLQVRTKVKGNNQIGTYTLYPWIQNNQKYSVSTVASANVTQLNQSNKDNPVPADELYNLLIKNNANFMNLINTQFGGGNQEVVDELLKFDNKVVRFLDGQGGYVFKEIGIISNLRTSGTTAITAGGLYTNLYNTIRTRYEGDWLSASANQYSFETFVTYQEYSIKVSNVAKNNIKVSFPATASKLSDAPYSMFALPYNDITIGNVNIEGKKNFQLASQLAIQASSALYDLQLLPYCPMVGKLTNIEGLTLDNLIEGTDYAKITNNLSPAQTIGYVFFPTSCSFTLDIPISGYSQDSFDTKMTNECDMFRLCSPNYNGQFEFNIAKNGGVTNFNVDCTYLPYQPYIHVNPSFSLLYGKDFNDARGLICGGDFSLARMSDAWENYKLQNKNFQEIFDRQIENMEVQQSAAREQDIWGGIAGVFSGAGAGALTGSSMFPGPVGALGGAAAGAVASTIGGIADYSINEKLRAEALDYTKDNFGYQLDNIKALPQSITKITAYNFNNKIFPIFEHYSCTEEEKIAVANKIAYNGMTTMVIGKIKDYLNNTWSYNNDIKSKGYIKGKLINLELPVSHREGLHSESYNIVNAISGELDKGVFTQWA